MTIFAPPSNVTGIVDVFSYGNTVTGGLFGIALLLIVFVVSFVALKVYPTEKAMAASSFTTALTSYMLSAVSLVPNYAVLITTIMVIASVFLLWKGDSSM